jgi:hypothetical protein
MNGYATLLLRSHDGSGFHDTITQCLLSWIEQYEEEQYEDAPQPPTCPNCLSRYMITSQGAHLLHILERGHSAVTYLYLAMGVGCE